MTRHTLPLQRLLLILLALAVLAACTAPGGRAPSLQDTQWRVTQIAGQAVPAEREVTLTFQPDGTASGRGPCNGYYAEYRQTGTALTFRMLASTMMYCDTPGVMEMERVFIHAMEQVRSFQLQDQTLTLLDDRAQPVLVLSR